VSFFAPELATRRFRNLRPVRRASILMWVVGGFVLAFNIWLYATHFSALSSHHERLAELEAELEVERAEVDDFESRISEVDLGWQNRQVVLLNALIEQRTFSWSDLIDDLAEVLPPQVRLYRLTPRIAADDAARGRDTAAAEERRVALGISGSADTDEALLAFIDALFEHPRFANPRLAGESRGEAGDISGFTMTADYLPAAVSTEAADEGAMGSSDEGAEGSPDEGAAPDGEAGAAAAEVSEVEA
jgi:Tfp pilus assembly protein PilN